MLLLFLKNNSAVHYMVKSKLGELYVGWYYHHRSEK